MPAMRSSIRVSAVLFTVLFGSVAPAQTSGTSYEPRVGQAGKDVVWVPTPQALVDKMLDMAHVTPADFVMDLGSGDGRTVITAAKRGARAMGVEYNPDMVAVSKAAAAKEGVSTRATFVQADLYKTDLSRATVITMFLLPTINLQLRPTLLKLKPGIRIVSNSFDMGEWEPDETQSVSSPDCKTWCKALMWIVPAPVQGTWKSTRGVLTITQSFQNISGTLGAAPIKGKMVGDQITFVAGSAEYSGKVSGTRIKGSDWSAERAK